MFCTSIKYQYVKECYYNLGFLARARKIYILKTMNEKIMGKGQGQYGEERKLSIIHFSEPACDWDRIGEQLEYKRQQMKPQRTSNTDNTNI